MSASTVSPCLSRQNRRPLMTSPGNRQDTTSVMANCFCKSGCRGGTCPRCNPDEDVYSDIGTAAPASRQRKSAPANGSATKGSYVPGGCRFHLNSPRDHDAR